MYVDIPSSNSNTGNFDFTLAKLGDSNTLDLELSALESEGKVQIISQPNLITINKKPAYIEAGEDVPYQEKTGEGNTSTNFKKAVLQLKVTPKILSNNKILLDIDISQDNVTSLMINGVPAIETKRIKTQTLVKNRQTVVLGGIHEQNRNTQTNKIPHNVFLTKIRRENESLSIWGTSQTHKAITSFIKNIKKSNFFTNPILKEIKMNDLIHFILVCEIRR